MLLTIRFMMLPFRGIVGDARLFENERPSLILNIYIISRLRPKVKNYFRVKCIFILVFRLVKTGRWSRIQV